MAAKPGWGTSNQAATGNTGMAINDSPTLENEADIMGAKAARGDIAHVSGSSGNAVQKDGDDDENYENFDIKVICIILENIHDGDNKVVGMKGEQYIEVIDNGGETKREFIEDINWLEDEIKEGTLVTNEDGSLVEISHDYEMPAEPLIFDVTKPIVTISRQNEPQNEPKVILRFPTDHTEGGIQIHGIGRSEGCILASGDMLELIFNIFKEQNFKPLLGQISLVIDKRSEEERIEASVYYPNNPGYVINENPSGGALQNLESGFNEWVGFVDYCSFVNFRIDNQMGDEYVIDELKKGTEVKVIGKNGEWLHVEVAFGGSIIRGYIHKNYIRHPIESKFIGKHQTIDELAEEEGGMEKIIAAIRFAIENPGDESLPDWAQQISEFVESMGLDLMMLSDLTYLIYPFKEPLTSEEEKNRLEENNKRAIKFIVEKILDYLFDLNEANGEDNNGISLSVSEEEIEIIPELLEDFLSSSDEISSLNKDNFLNEIEAYLSQKEGIDEKYKGLIEEIIRIFVVLQRDIIEKLPELEGASFDIDGNNEIDNEELENMINFYLEVISVLEYKFDYEQGIFFTTPDAHQQHFGYCDLYNEAADEVLNYKIDYFTVPISAKNPEGEDQVYKIRGWKGNYWGAIGGEIGCYTGDLPLLDWAGEEATGASKDFMLEMGFILYDEEFNQIFKRYKEENWWVIGLKPGELELFEDVRTKYTMEGLINFDSYPNLVDGFIQEAPKQGLENISRSGNSVVFTWKEPVNSSGTAEQSSGSETDCIQSEDSEFEFNTEYYNDIGSESSSEDLIDYLILIMAPVSYQLYEFHYNRQLNSPVAKKILTQDSSGESNEIVILDDLIELYSTFRDLVSNFIEFINDNGLINKEGLKANGVNGGRFIVDEEGLRFNKGKSISDEIDNNSSIEIINEETKEVFKEYKANDENEINLSDDIDKIRDNINNREELIIPLMDYELLLEYMSYNLYFYVVLEGSNGEFEDLYFKVDFIQLDLEIVGLKISLKKKFGDAKWTIFSKGIENEKFIEQNLKDFDESYLWVESWLLLDEAPKPRLKYDIESIEALNTVRSNDAITGDLNVTDENLSKIEGGIKLAYKDILYTLNGFGIGISSISVSIHGFDSVIVDLKKGRGWAIGAEWTLRYIKNNINNFNNRNLKFEERETWDDDSGQNIRKVDLLDDTDQQNKVYYEFKSVKDVPPGSFNEQFCKDLKNPDINSLLQIIWIFDREKYVNEERNTEDTFYTNMKNAIDNLSLTDDLAEKYLGTGFDADELKDFLKSEEIIRSIFILGEDENEA